MRWHEEGLDSVWLSFGAHTAVPSDDRREGDRSAATAAPEVRPRSATLPPQRQGSASPVAPALAQVRRRGSLGDIDNYSAPPPRPPKPPPSASLASPTAFGVTTGRLNLAALPDSERALLDERNPFVASGSYHLYEVYLQRIRVGMAGALARRRPPSRRATNVRQPSHHSLSSASPLKCTVQRSCE